MVPTALSAAYQQSSDDKGGLSHQTWGWNTEKVTLDFRNGALGGAGVN